MQKHTDQPKSEMPQNHKFATPQVNKTETKESSEENETSHIVRNEPSTPDQIGSSIVRRHEIDDED